LANVGPIKNFDRDAKRSNTRQSSAIAGASSKTGWFGRARRNRGTFDQDRRMGQEALREKIARLDRR